MIPGAPHGGLVFKSQREQCSAPAITEQCQRPLQETRQQSLRPLEEGAPHDVIQDGVAAGPSGKRSFGVGLGEVLRMCNAISFLALAFFALGWGEDVLRMCNAISFQALAFLSYALGWGEDSGAPGSRLGRKVRGLGSAQAGSRGRAPTAVSKALAGGQDVGGGV